jgi:pantothenate kinase
VKASAETSSADWHGDARLVCDLVKASLRGNSRAIIAIAGPPASGKSTLAETVVRLICSESDSAVPQASLLPMDGYHLDNSILKSRGLLARKGAPETFDADGFCSDVKRLTSARRELFYPRFDRQLDLAIANSIVIHQQTPVIVVEGNYLLLKSKPWSSLRDVFTATVFLRPSLDILQNRLMQRWKDHGLDPQAAKLRVAGNDLPNAELVLRESREADLHLSQTQD